MNIPKWLTAISVVILYCLTFYFWSMPFQKEQTPYGEVDAASHYAVAEYTYYSDRSITDLPYYIDRRYGGDNFFVQHVLWYPPPFHTTLASFAVFFGDGIGIFFGNAILCSLIVLSVFFIMRQLFNYLIAIFSALLLSFSMRDILVYLWGQWPERAAFAYVPLALYCLYKYSTGYIEGQENSKYLYMLVIFTAIGTFMHPMILFHIAASAVLFSIFFAIKHKKAFFNWKKLIIAGLLFLVIMSVFPLQAGNIFFKAQQEESAAKDKYNFARLFFWIQKPTGKNDVSSEYFSYSKMIAPIWTTLLILIAIAVMVFRRNPKDLLFLSWLIGLYVMVHLDFFGKGRVHRSLSGSSHLFFPLMLIGVSYIVFVLPKQYKSISKAILIAAVGIIVLLSIARPALDVLYNSYPIPQRPNQFQVEMVEWMKGSSIPANATIFHFGSINIGNYGFDPIKNSRWLWMMGHRFLDYNPAAINSSTYLLFDYSIPAMASDTGTISLLQQAEQSINRTPLHYNDYLRVYQIG